MSETQRKAVIKLAETTLGLAAILYPTIGELRYQEFCKSISEVLSAMERPTTVQPQPSPHPDSVRLDWLEQKAPDVECRSGLLDAVWTDYNESRIKAAKGSSLRSAIDEAMRKARKI